MLPCQPPSMAWKLVPSLSYCSHLGRPNRKCEKFPIALVAEVVEEKLGMPAQLLREVVSSEVEAAHADPSLVLPEGPSLCAKKKSHQWCPLFQQATDQKNDEKLILSSKFEIAGVLGSLRIAKFVTKQFRSPLLTICQGSQTALPWAGPQS